MRRALVVVFAALMALTMDASAAHADRFDPRDPRALTDADWEHETVEAGEGRAGDTTVEAYCKGVNEATSDDETSVRLIGSAGTQEAVQEFADHYTELLEGTEHEADEGTDYVAYCVAPDRTDNLFFCVARARDLPRQEGLFGGNRDKEAQCWSQDGERHQTAVEAVEDAVTNPVGTAANAAIESFANELGQAIRAFFAALLYWWILLPHEDLETTPSMLLWPFMLGFGLLVGTTLFVIQGIRMAISRQPGILVSTLKGLAVYTVVVVAGVGLVGAFAELSDATTMGFISVGMSMESGCVERVINDEVQLEELNLPQAETEGDIDEENAQAGRAFAHCGVVTLVAAGMSAPWAILMYVVAFILTFFQAILLYLRELVVPIAALMLPIAAAGQIGPASTRRWLPGLLAIIVTLLLYKPMVAFIYSVGFLNLTLGTDSLDIIRGMITLTVGVVAPGFLLKTFRPLMPSPMEEGSGLGASMNNLFLGTQMAGPVSQWMDKRAGASAAAKQSAHSAAHEGGGQLVVTASRKGAQTGLGTAATAAAGPIGWAAKAGQLIKSAVPWLARKSEGPQTGSRLGRMLGRPGHTPGYGGGQMHVRQPGQHLPGQVPHGQVPPGQHGPVPRPGDPRTEGAPGGPQPGQSGTYPQWEDPGGTLPTDGTHPYGGGPLPRQADLQGDLHSPYEGTPQQGQPPHGVPPNRWPDLQPPPTPDQQEDDT